MYAGKTLFAQPMDFVPWSSFFFLEVFEPDPAPGLAVDRDQFGQDPGLRRDPGDKATPEWLGVERGQDVAQVVVHRVPSSKGRKRLRKASLCRPNLAMVRDRLRPGDDGEQAQQQNLIERIFDLAALRSAERPADL